MTCNAVPPRPVAVPAPIPVLTSSSRSMAAEDPFNPPRMATLDDLLRSPSISSPALSVSSLPESEAAAAAGSYVPQSPFTPMDSAWASGFQARRDDPGHSDKGAASYNAEGSSIFAPSTAYEEPAAPLSSPVVTLAGAVATLIVENVHYVVDSVLLARYSSRLAQALRKSSTVVFEGVAREDFETFMKALYPEKFGAPGVSTQDEWSAVLRVADAWTFPDVRAVAIAALDALVAPIDRILLARLHHIPDWADEGLIALCRREAQLNVDESRRLKNEDVLFVGKFRGKVVASDRAVADFHALFPDVPKKERLLNYFSCYLGERSGYLYVTKPRICFNSGTYLRMLPFADIASVKQGPDEGILATRKIQIKTGDTTEVLSRFGFGSYTLVSELLDELHRFAQLG